MTPLELVLSHLLMFCFWCLGSLRLCTGDMWKTVLLEVCWCWHHGERETGALQWRSDIYFWYSTPSKQSTCVQSNFVFISSSKNRPQSGQITPPSVHRNRMYATKLKEIMYWCVLKEDHLSQDLWCVLSHDIITHTADMRATARQHFLPFHRVSCSNNRDRIHTDKIV